MTKQEEIREGIDDIIDQMAETYMSHTERWTLRDLILKKLSSQGVVIKVDRELPLLWNGKGEMKTALAYKNELASYVAVEPLIEVGVDLFLCPYCHQEHLPGSPHLEPLVKE